jgi:hypothetical protein
VRSSSSPPSRKWTKKKKKRTKKKWEKKKRKGFYKIVVVVRMWRGKRKNKDVMLKRGEKRRTYKKGSTGNLEGYRIYNERE